MKWCRLVQTAWGTHSLTKATRLLLKAALQNPLNQRFLLMCGTSIPLRPARFTYTQLLAEQRSRFYWFFHHEEEVKAEVRTNLHLAAPLCMSCFEGL